jgi:hypothetical protein
MQLFLVNFEERLKNLQFPLQREKERTKIKQHYGIIQHNLKKEFEELSDWKEEALQKKIELEDQVNQLTLQLQSVRLNNQSLQQKAVQLRTSLPCSFEKHHPLL